MARVCGLALACIARLRAQDAEAEQLNAHDDSQLARAGWEPLTRGARAFDPWRVAGEPGIGGGTYLEQDLGPSLGLQLGRASLTMFCNRQQGEEFGLHVLLRVSRLSPDALRLQLDDLPPRDLELNAVPQWMGMGKRLPVDPNASAPYWRILSMSLPRPKDGKLHTLQVSGRDSSLRLRALRLDDECHVARAPLGTPALTGWQLRDAPFSSGQLDGHMADSFFATTRGGLMLRTVLPAARLAVHPQQGTELLEITDGWHLHSGHHVLKARATAVRLPVGVPALNLTAIRNASSDLITLRMIEQGDSVTLEVLVQGDDGRAADLSSLHTNYHGSCRHVDLGPLEHACSATFITATSAKLRMLGEEALLETATGHGGDNVSLSGEQWQLEGEVQSDGTIFGLLRRHGVADGHIRLQPQQAEPFRWSFDSGVRIGEPLDFELAIKNGVLHVSAFGEVLRRDLQDAAFFENPVYFSLGPRCEFSFGHPHVIEDTAECQVLLENFAFGHAEPTA